MPHALPSSPLVAVPPTGRCPDAVGCRVDLPSAVPASSRPA